MVYTELFRASEWNRSCSSSIREFKQSTTAGATTAAMTEKVWGEYVSVRSLNFKFSETKYKETRAKEFKTSFIYFLTA